MFWMDLNRDVDPDYFLPHPDLILDPGFAAFAFPLPSYSHLAARFPFLLIPSCSCLC
jgi:hypothetical protein